MYALTFLQEFFQFYPLAMTILCVLFAKTSSLNHLIVLNCKLIASTHQSMPKNKEEKKNKKGFF